MNETVPLIAAIVGALGTWTATVAVLSFWLAGRFRQLERLVYQEQSKLDAKYMMLFKEHGNRIMTLELRRFGRTDSSGLEG